MELIELYARRSDKCLVQTVNGIVTWKQFLRDEKKRIEKNPKRVARIISVENTSWLLVDEIAMPKKKEMRQKKGGWLHIMPTGQRHVMS